MATQENIEYLALLRCTVELIREIFAHPLSVATTLYPLPPKYTSLVPHKGSSGTMQAGGLS